MTDFISDEEMKKIESEGSGSSAPDFIPDGHPSLNDSVEVPKIASASAGFLSSVPFAKQIGAGAKTGMDVLTGITPILEAGNEYSRERDALGEDLDRVKSANPKSAFLGGLASAPVLQVSGEFMRCIITYNYLNS